MPLEPLHVLITAAGGAGAPGIIRSLRENGERTLRVIAVDADPLAVGLHLADAGCVVPLASAPEYVDVLLDICARERVAVVLPGISYELQRLAAERSRFDARGVKVAVPALETLLTLDNKARLYETLAAHGVPVAAWRRVEAHADLPAAATALGYPQARIVLKHQVGSGGKGMSLLDARAAHDPDAYEQQPFLAWTLEAAQAYYSRQAAFPPLVAMELLPGLEYSCDLLVDHGQVVYCCPRTRESVRHGTSFRARLVNDPEALALCARIAGCFDYGGNMNIQLKRSPDGALMPVEVNPRLSGTVGFCTAAGVNLPFLGVLYHLGEPVPQVEPRWGAQMIRHYAEIVLE